MTGGFTGASPCVLARHDNAPGIEASEGPRSPHPWLKSHVNASPRAAQGEHSYCKSHRQQVLPGLRTHLGKGHHSGLTVVTIRGAW